MRIWFINHYAVPPQYYPLSRPSLFAKNLIRMGHDVTIIAASSIHNSESKNLIHSRDKVRIIIEDGITYVLIKCTSYQGNGIRRVINILEFAQKLPKVLDSLEKPDAIISTCFDPFACFAGIKYAKENSIKAIAEIADLWPETLVAYKGISPKNPIVKCLRAIEKKTYIDADAIIFTMEGGFDYIVEQGWEKEVQRNKVHYINNGIDLKQFDYNKEHYTIDDNDLKNTNSFKIVYAGSIRRINNLDKLLNVAKLVKNKNIKFLIWGNGDELSHLMERKQREKIDNVLFKGFVEKKFIPYITSSADLNFAHNESSPLFRFGISFNKIFDYLAAGKPVLCDFEAKYNPVLQEKAGFSVQNGEERVIAEMIDIISTKTSEELKELSKNAKLGAKKYDFCLLSEQLIRLIESI